MSLKDWIQTNGVKHYFFAKELGISRGRLFQIMNGSKPSKSVAKLIEIKTAGQVKEEDLLK